MPDVLRQRRYYGKYSLLKTSWKYQTREFFERSTIHGLRYFSEKGKPSYQKVMWFSIISIGAVVSFIIIVPLWEKFQTSPTITSVDMNFHNWDVPFPGITLCTNTRYSEKRSAAIITEPCCIDPQVGFRCEDFIRKCTFKGQKIPCCESFRPTFTEHGLCYSFNTIYSEVDWPWKPRGFNATMEKLHQLYETDNNWSIGLTLNIKKINSTQVKVRIQIWTGTGSSNYSDLPDANARQLSIKQRKCVFKDEIKLKTAKEYSQWACMNECRMKLAMERCSCVPFTNFALHELQNGTGCFCELSCDHTVYELEKFGDTIEGQKYSLEIGLVSWPIIRYKRKVLFGWVDLIGAIGGIAGLFLGFSLLSGFEMVYYFTLRAACMVYRSRHEVEELRYRDDSLPTHRINLSLAPDFPGTTPEHQSDHQMQTSELSVFHNRVVVPDVTKTSGAWLTHNNSIF
ncbi:unnamed protein product [Nesidiocoris tenuis]|uniref:Uncharacterized protein n=1 Tax=Nesidiocoris tenuis TaxID=355587 RepID=A0A6H5GP65_9HEMI|nr:unnamed protein product [Nesidiocoris tenuis]